jgi:Zn-dependent peptidase ImmA (M78 family)
MNALTLLFVGLFSYPLFGMVEKTIHTESPRINANKKWSEYTSSEELNIRKLLELLGRSETGEKLIKEASFKAAQSGMTIMDVIKAGEGSLTDTTLVRKFNPHSPEHVTYESKSIVYLNKNLSWDDALLDLAHELTHLIYRESFNPYADNFNAKDFIKGTIEGSGGEVHAFITECQVLDELFSRMVQSRSHCRDIKDESGQVSFSKAVKLFYQVGKYYDSFSKKLATRSMDDVFSELKGEKINFISSAYGVPYPIAALMEYDLVVNKVCENDRKRLAYMQQGLQREPASTGESKDKFLASFNNRCSRK